MQKYREMHSLSVISSSVCNLNCSFCYLHKNQSYKEFDSLVRQAWQDGSYVNNLLKTVQGLNGEPLDITCMQLWGGETLLHIEDVTMNVKKIYTYFPKIHSWKVSTNLLVDINKVFEFFKEIEKYTESPTEIALQISIDGPPGPFSEAGHNGNWDIYRKNLNQLVDLMNNTRFRKIFVDIIINATVAKDLYLTKFLDYQEMKNYVKYFIDFMQEIDNKCTGKAINVLSMEVFPTYANPSMDTSEDGQKLLAICRLWDLVHHNEFPDLNPQVKFYKGTGDISHNFCFFEPNPECSELSHSFTINYDGSICECSGNYISGFEPYLQELLKENEMKLYHQAQVAKTLMYNPDTATKDEKEYYDWTIHRGYKNNQSTYLHCMISIANELAKSGQIDPIYLTDKDLLLKHLLALANVNSCSKENVSTTGIPYLISTSTLRRYLNGFIEYGYNDQLAVKKEEKIKFTGERGGRGPCC